MQLTIKNKLRALAILPVLFLSIFLLFLNNYEAESLVESQLKEPASNYWMLNTRNSGTTSTWPSHR